MTHDIHRINTADEQLIVLDIRVSDHRPLAAAVTILLGGCAGTDSGDLSALPSVSSSRTDNLPNEVGDNDAAPTRPQTKNGLLDRMQALHNAGEEELYA